MAEAAPEAFTVRIAGPDGRPGGLGVLVAGRYVVTCAHVVNAALGLTSLSQPWPRDRVRVEFPLLGAGDAGVPGVPGVAGNARIEASIVKWLPPPAPGVAGDDIAGLELATGSMLPARAKAARLGIQPPRPGDQLHVFGYPSTPPRPDGGWVPTTVAGVVGNGRLQLDSAPDAALRIQPGFSGGPVLDHATGRIVGLLAMAARNEARDSYAISADRLRLAWPEVLAGRWQQGTGAARRRESGELTILHVSDLRSGMGRPTDLAALTAAGLRPDLLVVTGNLAEQGLPAEFQRAAEVIGALAEEAEIPRRHVAIVPGARDVNRHGCQAYFLEQESDGKQPVPPYWRKWRQYADMFKEFYAGLDTVTFTPDEPWTLFEMPDLAVVVAGLNSTMADSHLDADHYGWVGVPQLQWFRARLERYRARGWLRLAAVHHGAVSGADSGETGLSDSGDVDRILGRPALVNLLLHGDASIDGPDRLPSRLATLYAGGPADGTPRPHQLVTVRRGGFTRVSVAGDDPSDQYACDLTDVDEAFPAGAQQRPDRVRQAEAETALPGSEEASDSFLGRVAEATRARFPRAMVTERRRGVCDYLRVSQAVDGSGAEVWPVGVIDGPASEAGLAAFVADVHRQFAAADPQVRSELVYAGPAAPADLVGRARQDGVRLRSFVDYQGLLDLTALAERQRDRLAGDRIYPARLYVDQRYRIVSGGGHTDEVRTGLIDRAVTWLAAEGARLVVVLGDFGRGKTSFLRQLTRVLPGLLTGVMPILVELRSLEKAPSLDELLAQHLARQGVDDINLGKLRYMISSGRIALLLDGFDELELRVGYENAADYLQTLITAVTGQAKVIMTSRTQHFRSTRQVRDALSGRLAQGRTALGERVETRPESRVVVLEEFSDEQITAFLTNLYEEDAVKARARFDLIRGIGNLLDVVHNPRMLSFVADLDERRLRDAQDETGQISAARLYEEIIDQWLDIEAERHQHRAGLPSITKQERYAACTALAFRLWASNNPTIALQDLSAEVTATLTGLAERGYTEEQATHSIASGSLLVRTEDGAFAFIHQSVMEWLIAKAAAEEQRGGPRHKILGTRYVSRLMAEFFVDLAGSSSARRWASAALEDQNTPEAAKQNALAVMDRMPTPPAPGATPPAPEPQNLAGMDLRGQDLTGRDMRGANLRGANLRGMRLNHVDLSEADLSAADLTGAVISGGSLRGAILTGSTWNRAALLGVRGLDSPDVTALPELASAALAGRDTADVMIQPRNITVNSAVFSPDGLLIAYSSGSLAAIADATDGRVLRILRGHVGEVRKVAFSPDGALLATVSEDRTARTWTTVTGDCHAVLTHDREVMSLAFSPDGALLATASEDGVARIWDLATNTVRTSFTGYYLPVYNVAFSPDGTRIATASHDNTARIWDVDTGNVRSTLTEHDGYVYSVNFSPDGTLLAAGCYNGVTRLWDLSTGTSRTTLSGHRNAVNDVAFSPDGTLVATASWDRTARIWDTATGTPRTTISGHSATVTSAAFSPDGGLLATGSLDRTVRLWDAATGNLRISIAGNERFVSAVAFSSGARRLATAGPDGTARVWDVATGTPRITNAVSDRIVTAVAFSWDGVLLATANTDGTACTWDTATGQRHVAIGGHNDYVAAIAFSPDGRLLATGSNDKTARTWDAQSGKLCSTLTGHGALIHAVAFSPDGNLLATASSDRTARIWRATGQGTTGMRRRRKLEIARLEGHAADVLGVAFSPDGTLVATGSGDSTARVWDTATGSVRKVLAGHGNWVVAVAFSPDGTLIATASMDCTVRVWKTADGSLQATLTGHDGPPLAAAFSPDGSLIATASMDGTTRIWEVASAAHLATLIALPDGGYVTLLPDGTYKRSGDPSDRVWWAIKLCRFEAGELDEYVPVLRAMAAEEPVIHVPEGL